MQKTHSYLDRNFPSERALWLKGQGQESNLVTVLYRQGSKITRFWELMELEVHFQWTRPIHGIYIVCMLLYCFWMFLVQFPTFLHRSTLTKSKVAWWCTRQNLQNAKTKHVRRIWQSDGTLGVKVFETLNKPLPSRFLDEQDYPSSIGNSDPILRPERCLAENTTHRCIGATCPSSASPPRPWPVNFDPVWGEALAASNSFAISMQRLRIAVLQLRSAVGSCLGQLQQIFQHVIFVEHQSGTSTCNKSVATNAQVHRKTSYG